MQNIVIWHERMGKSPDEIASEYGLTLGDVYAALAYYFDHLEDIERQIRDDETFAHELRHGYPSLLARKIESMRDESIFTNMNNTSIDRVSGTHPV